MTLALNFRTTDNTKWGEGSGAPLAAEDVDLNFWVLKQAVETLQTDMPDALVSISGFAVEGDQFYVDLTDDSRQGPFDLPTVVWNFRGVWTSDTVYNVNDVVSYGTTIYLVLTTHTSDVAFDPSANDGEGNDYYSVMIDMTGFTIPVGGTAGQLLAKSSGTDFDTEWIDPPGNPDTLEAPVTYLDVELIEDGNLATDPETLLTPWVINNNTWALGEVSGTYTGFNDITIEIPISGLEIGSWYLFSMTGAITEDVNYAAFPFGVPDAAYLPPNGTHSFLASAESGTLTLSLKNFTVGAVRSITSVSLRQIEEPTGAKISNGVNFISVLGADQDNTFIGEGAGEGMPAYGTVNVSGNIGIGRGALNSVANGLNNIAIGNFALANVIDEGYNIAIGTGALGASQSGVGNVAIGVNSGSKVSNGSRNVFISEYAGASLETGIGNVAVGYSALSDAVGSNYNVAVGYEAGNRSTSNNNVFIGYLSGYIADSEDQLVIIGSNADIVADVTNAVAIGFGAVVGESNSVQLGNTSVVKARVGTKELGLPQHALVSGAAAGSVTVTGINTDDRLDEVIYYDASHDVFDITSEFIILSDNTLDNTGGTNTTGGKLLVRWTSLT